MDGELVSSSPSDTTSNSEGGEADGPAPLRRFEDVFRQRFPYYLSIGMTEAQYWEGDCTLVKAYEEAEKMRRDRRNQEAWLQGMYFYDALSRISPILHAFAKKGTKAQPYVEEPYPLDQKQVDEKKRKQEKQKSDKGLRYMKNLVASNNHRFEERK